MANDLWHVAFPWWHFLIRAGIVYSAVLILIRMSGKRQVGQMGIHELVALLLISNAVQNSMNGGDNSITGGMILAGTLVAMAFLLSFFTYRSRKFEAFVQGKPRLLIHRGKLLKENLRKELLSYRELKTVLRRQGIHDLAEVEEAVLESDGFVCVIRKAEMNAVMEEMEAFERNDVY
jgi:uncharacterized membrane protein YcaP (DUF421 family)